MNDGNLTSAVILVVAGYLLLTLEVFLPTGGILGALSLAAICIGVTFGFKSSLMAGSLVLAGTVAGVPLLLKALTWLWPKTAMGKKMTVESEAGEGTVGSLPGNIALEQLVGAFGIVTSELRPAGSIDFSGKKSGWHQRGHSGSRWPTSSLHRYAKWLCGGSTGRQPGP